MPFEIGKTYKTRGGISRTVVAIVPDGRLIVQNSFKKLEFRNPDGSYESSYGTRLDQLDLINTAEPTAEELEKYAKLLDAMNCTISAEAVRRGYIRSWDFAYKGLPTFLELIRHE